MGEVLRLAFPRYRFGTPQQDQSFRLTRDEADAALNELSPHFQAIAGLYAGDLDTMEDGRRNEVWTFFDPAASTASLRETSHPAPKANALAVAAALRTVKRFCLYAHRVVVEDHLFEWLNEYANPPVLHVLGRTDEWLLNGIAFQLALYDALLSLLDDEVVLPMACTPPFLDRSRDQEIASILGGSATRLALNESIISHIKLSSSGSHHRRKQAVVRRSHCRRNTRRHFAPSSEGPQDSCEWHHGLLPEFRGALPATDGGMGGAKTGTGASIFPGSPSCCRNWQSARKSLHPNRTWNERGNSAGRDFSP